MSYMSESDTESEVSMTNIDDMPFDANDKAIVDNFKTLIQQEKQRIYRDTIRKTTNGANLDNLHLYEVNLYGLGTDLLKGLYDFQESNTNNISAPLWAIVKDTNLSSDARILIENEIRNQFIQYPYNQKVSNNM